MHISQSDKIYIFLFEIWKTPYKTVEYDSKSYAPILLAYDRNIAQKNQKILAINMTFLISH